MRVIRLIFSVKFASFAEAGGQYTKHQGVVSLDHRQAGHDDETIQARG
jgi:hypothetical protein